jgi:hypothetical protein
MASAVSFLALTFLIQDVTLPNGVRLISSPVAIAADKSAVAADKSAVAIAADKSVVVVVGEADQGAYATWPSPSAAPLPPAPARDEWRIESGAPSLVVEWAAPPADDTLLLAALLGGNLERRDGILRLTIEDGWPPESRRHLDGELERLASLSSKELPAVKEACAGYATPKNNDERARRLLEVTLATGNPRLYRELQERCARLTMGTVSAAAKKLHRQPRRIVVKTPVEPRASGP